MKALALALCLATATGCSWIFVEGPQQPYHPQDAPYCDTRSAWVGVDWALAAIHGLLALAYLSSDYEDDQATGAINLVWTGIHTGSAISGGRKTARCREAWRLHQQHRGGYRPIGN